MSIGERITELRRQQNMSQAELARAMSVSRQAVSKWENDQSSPDSIKLIQLAEVLDTEVEYLATGRKPVCQDAPVVINSVRTVEVEKMVEVEKLVEVEKPVEVEKRVEVEKIVEKPVIRKVYRVRYLRNPVEFTLVGFVCFIIGLLIGFFL